MARDRLLRGHGTNFMHVKIVGHSRHPGIQPLAVILMTSILNDCTHRQSRLEAGFKVVGFCKPWKR